MYPARAGHTNPTYEIRPRQAKQKQYMLLPTTKKGYTPLPTPPNGYNLLPKDKKGYKLLPTPSSKRVQPAIRLNNGLRRQFQAHTASP